MRPAQFKHPLLWALIIMLGGTAVRYWFVASGQLNLVQDEAQYWDWTRHLQLTYYSKGPLIAWIIKLGTVVFGNTELGVRAGSVFGSLLTQLVLYFGLARLMKRPSLGFWAIVVFNTMPLMLGLGILMTTDNPFCLFWTLSIFLLYAGSKPRAAEYPDDGKAPNWPFVLLAPVLGLGILAKYTMLGFLGLSVFYGLALALLGLLPRRFFKRLALALGGGLILGFLPTLIWNVQNGFVGYKHVLYLIGAEGTGNAAFFHPERVPEYLGAQVGLAQPLWFLLMAVGSLAAVRTMFRRRTKPDMDEPALLDQRQSALFFVFFVPVWLFFFAWSFHSKVLPNWTTVSYLAGAVLAADVLLRTWHSARRGWRILLRFALAFAVAITVVILASPVLPLPDSINITARLKGWEDLGRTVDEYRTSAFADPEHVFVFSELYDMTAALAFYVPGQPRTYCAWIDDRRMNQYDLWPGPQDHVGWDAIYVMKRFGGQVPGTVAAMFDHVQGPIHVETSFDGRPARKFTLYLCYGYNGIWPRFDSGSF